MKLGGWGFTDAKGTWFAFFFSIARASKSNISFSIPSPDFEKNYGKFRAFILKEKRNSQVGKELVRERYFRSKWKAKDWAFKMYCKKTGRKFFSLHFISDARKEQGKKLYAKLLTKREQRRMKTLGLKPKFSRVILKRNPENKAKEEENNGNETCQMGSEKRKSS